MHGTALGMQLILHILPQLAQSLAILLDLSLKLGTKLLEVSPSHDALLDHLDGLLIGLHIKRQISDGLREAVQALIEALPDGTEVCFQECIDMGLQQIL